MGKDKSMFGWTPERLDEKARDDVAAGKYEPPPSWIPGASERPGTEARDTYDGSHDHYSGKDDD